MYRSICRYYEYVIFNFEIFVYFANDNYLVGNFDSHVRQQFGRLGGAMCTSHCLNFSNAKGSPGWRTNGFCMNAQQMRNSRLGSLEGLLWRIDVSRLPLQMLHCCQCPINRRLHLNSPALAHVVSSSCFPDASLRPDPHK